MSTKPEIHMPTPEQDAVLTAAAIKNVPIVLRIEPAVLAAFQGSGAGWQTRMNKALREWAQDHGLLPADA